MVPVLKRSGPPFLGSLLMADNDASGADRSAVIAALLAQGVQRSAVVAQVMGRFGVSRATAYRLVADAETSLPTEYHRPLTANDGTLDTLAEAERHYRLALQQGNSAQIRLWLAMVHRFSLDAARLRPFEAWDHAIGEHTEPF